MSAEVSLPIAFDFTTRECRSAMNLSLVATTGHAQLMATPPQGRSMKFGRSKAVGGGHCGSLSPARTQSPARKDAFSQGLSVCTGGLVTDKLFCAQCTISRSSSNNSLSSNSELVITTSTTTSSSTRREVTGDTGTSLKHALASALSEPFVSLVPCLGKKDVMIENTCGGIAESMSPHQLAARLEKGESKGVLVVDCRSFIAFNMNHVRDSVNLCCANRVVRKRIQSGKVQLSDLVSGEEAKESFRDKVNMNYDIVVYDENTTDPNQIQPNTSLHAIITVLQKQGNEAFFLQGGLNEFQSRYNHLCAKPCPPPSKAPLYSPTTPIVHSEIDTAVASQILPFLYIGNERDAANRGTLKELGVTHVLNATSHLPLLFEDDGIIYKRLPASDSANQNLKQYFADAFNFIDEARRAGGRVLVHCQAGVSRSSTLTIAYIMKHSHMNMMDTFKFVKNRRSIIAPNFNFMGQLLEFETHLNEGKICRDVEQCLGVETPL